MSKKIEILLLCLFLAFNMQYAHSQKQKAIIDLGQLPISSSKSQLSAQYSQVKSINGALKKKKSLSFMNPDGEIFETRFEKIEIANQTKFHLTTGLGMEVVQLTPDKFHYYNSKASESNSEEMFLKVNSKEVIGTWVAKEHVLEFDIGKQSLEKHNRSSEGPTSKVHSHQCAIDIGKGSSSSSGFEKSSNTTKTIELGMVLDYSYVHSAGGLQEAIDKVIGVLTASSIDFNSEFDFQIQLQISDIVLSGCQSCDPWTNSTNSTEVQESVRDWVQNNTTLQQNDIILFWSDRDFDDDIIGSAQTNSVCTAFNTVILKDKSDILWELRVIASHEIGHTLGSLHDPNHSNTIMHPTLINSSIWSTASIQSINAGIANAACLSDLPKDCNEVREILIEGLSATELRISFDAEIADSVLIEIINLSTGIKTLSHIVDSNTSWIETDYIPCQDYKIITSPYCNDSRGVSKEVLWNSREEDGFTIESVELSDCRVEDAVAIYDLTFRVSNPSARMVSLTFKDEEYSIFLDEGIRTYVIPAISTTGKKDVSMYFVEKASAIPNCLGIYFIDEPSEDCAFHYVEDFENCALPVGWSSYNSAGNIHEAFNWKFEDGSRQIQNYGNADNSQSTKTIDGSCMAILDDDLINLSNYSGAAYLESSSFNLQKYDNIALTFDLIFDEFGEKGVNQSSLIVEVRKDDLWHEIEKVNENPCPWFSIWNTSCIQHMSLDLTPFKSPNMAVRWQFSDGNSGQWTGMAALDNVEIVARELNEGPCNNEDIHIDNSPTNDIIISGNMLYLSTMIDVSEASFSLSQGAILNPGSSVETGVDLNVAIIPCNQ